VDAAQAPYPPCIYSFRKRSLDSASLHPGYELLSQANPDAGLGYFIAQGVQPLGKRFFAVIALISQ
jgi:hypothetical protein